MPARAGFDPQYEPTSMPYPYAHQRRWDEQMKKQGWKWLVSRVRYLQEPSRSEIEHAKLSDGFRAAQA